MTGFILPELADDGSDARITAPAARRNMAAILEVLTAHAPETGKVLEIAAGSGEHSVAFSRALPGLNWQSSDIDPHRLASIKAWSALYGPDTLTPPISLNASTPGWSASLPRFDMILLVNLLHLISDIHAETVLTEILAALAPGGTAFLYGPFLRDGLATSDGDARFHASLRAEDPETGYKDLSWVLDRLGMLTVRVQDMPANNLMLIVTAP